MNLKVVIARNIAMMVVFGAVGLTMFTENVRTVQIVGLLGCGAVFGAAFTAIVVAIKSKGRKA
jgi:site-specific recombinase